MKNAEKIIAYIFYVWMITVTFLSVYKFGNMNAPENSDKVVHSIIYFLTALITYLYFFKFIRNGKLLVLASIIFASFYGFLMECVQYFLPYRSFSIADELANITGAITFGIILLLKNYIIKTGRKF